MKREKPQMTKKEAFIKIIQTEIFDRTDIYAENYPDEYELAASFWEDFKDGKVKIIEPKKELLAEYVDNNFNPGNNKGISYIVLNIE